ncbi:hypothetical protein WDW37_08940 [Bdellovibrionota bacterium FG-1]
MDYLKPIEQLKSRIKFNQSVIFSLLVLIGVLLVVVPHVLKGEPYLVEAVDGLPQILKSEPWRLSTSRIRGFSRAYLEARFHWSPESMGQARSRFEPLTTEAVFAKLKDSLSVNEAIAQNQKAESFYIIERETYSKAMDGAELQITRVLRIRNVGIATPLIIKLTIQAAPITDQNPYGFVVSGLEEEEAHEATEGEKH